MKAYPDKVLPSRVKRLIFSDADTIWVKDVYELWKTFDEMNSDQLFGAGPEYSLWYWKQGMRNLMWPQSESGLPADRTGFNAGTPIGIGAC